MAFINIDPEEIRTIKELDSIVSKIVEEEERRKCEVGVVLRQNRQLGGSYPIVSIKEANEGLNKPRKCEWYVKFYPRSYFEDLKKELNNKQKSYWILRS